MSDTLTLPVAGREYVISQPPARVGLAQSAAFTIAMTRRANVEREKSGKDPIEPPARAVQQYQARYGNDEHDMDVDSLGADVYEAMLDEITLPELKQAAQAAHLWIAIGGERGTKVALAWLGIDVEDDDAGPKASTTTGEGSTTPPPGSTSGTTSPTGTSSD